MLLGKTLFVILVVFAAQSAFAQNAPPVQEVIKGVLVSANNYAHAISCHDGQIEPKDVVTLIPYKTFDDRLDAKYAVLWSGDIGCAGGSGTNYTNISIVNVGPGDSYVVDPHLSSPIVTFESPVRHVDRIVRNTKDSLFLEGKEHGPNDANCCPSITVRFTLKVDKKGDWKLVNSQTLPAKR